MVQKNKTTLSVGILDLLEGPHNYRRVMTAAPLLLFTYLNVNSESAKVFFMLLHICVQSLSRGAILCCTSVCGAGYMKVTVSPR